ncbi:MAG: hypothetical protein HUJ86_06275 [Synergistes sp.]|nr:hypothetical protein [Synergistes sp.]
MTTNDFRLKEDEINLLKSFIGQEFVSMYHSDFYFTDAVSEVVKWDIAGEYYFLYSFTEERDYFGCKEDVAVWSVEREVYPPVSCKNLKEFPIKEIIKDIYIVNDHQKLSFNGKPYGAAYFVKGIIFLLESGREISFEKSVWFSEDIYIKKGYELNECFQSADEFAAEWKDSESYRGECIREVISLNNLRG